MGITLTDILLFGKAVESSVDSGTFRIYRRNILRWGALSGYIDVVVRGTSPLYLENAVEDGLKYVKAFGGTELRNVPEGYQELEYIESTGTQYIDTGVVVSTGSSLNGKIAITGAPASADTTALNGTTNSLTWGVLGPALRMNFCGDRSGYNYIQGVIYNISGYISDTERSMTVVGGNINQTFTASIATPISGNYYLFARNGTDLNSRPRVSMRLYSWSIKQNNVLVCNLIPAKRNSDNVVGMYDTVSGTFLTNAGTGTFVAGPKTVLPDGYTKLNYIDGTGLSQYINTGLNITPGMNFYFKGAHISGAGVDSYFGTRNSTTSQNGIMFRQTTNNITVDFFGATGTRWTINYTRQDNDIIEFRNNNLLVEVFINGTSLGTNQFTAEQSTLLYPLFIKALNNGGSPVLGDSGIRMYRFTIDGVCDLIPARRNSDNVAGMYDMVRNQFFPSSGAGSFTAGTEVIMPTPNAPQDIWCNNGVLKTAIFNQLLANGNFETSAGISSTGCTFSVADNTCLLLANTESGRVWLSQPATSGHKYLYTCDIRTTAPSSKIQLRIAGGPVTTSVFTTNWQTLSYIYNASSSNASLGVADTRTSDWDTVYIKNAMVFDLTQMFGAGNEPATTADAFAMIAKVYGQKLDYYPYDAGTPKAYAVGTVETVSVHSTNIFNKLTDDTHEGYFVNGSVINNLAAFNRTIVINCKPNTKYSFWHTAGVGGCRAFDLPTDTISVGDSATWLTPTSPTYKSANQVTTVTTHSNAKKLYICAGRQETDVTRSFDDQLADFMLVEGEISTATEYVPYFNGGSATCEDLLSVSNYTDEQELIAGNLIRKVGVKVLTGTEDWSRTDARAALTISDAKLGEENLTPICTHYYCMDSIIQISSMPDNSCKINASSNMLLVKDSTHNTSLEAWKQYLADQYAAGTPVIVVYPLATPTTESVAGQTLQVADGDNTLEITQASLNNLELEAKYQAAVTLTIQEVQDANLDPNVQVTIN